MVGLFDAFEVYNKKKHSSNPQMLGHTSNTGGTRTDFVYSSEYRAPNPKKVNKDELLTANPAEAQEAQTMANNAGVANMVDVSRMSQHELEDLMKTLRKGEPNNRVNF
ncbi:LANO_0D07448g1_1 [Lachancea nothofagi CBS 11611]|uniref:Stationary phase protein 4 n=1 Tax=Lachancea nothofagi CBS 11611 TaxID=1266666 RepID=A0A1G4JI35_9SACH|nr:LANO_0D07448g1_1 [Lachancea nothofagi CBS 11611]